MLITKFNALIRNRWVWGAFAGTVALFFLGVGMTDYEGCRRMPSADERAAGKVFGESVSLEEFQQARFFATAMRRTAQRESEDESDIRRRTWERIAALRQAKNMGLTATDQEISELVQKDPTFSVNGVFNPERYQTIVRSQLGVDIITFENYLREDITLQKLMGVFESVAWTPPAEVNRRLDGLTDAFTVEYVRLERDKLAKGVEVTEEDARRFFEDNKTLFTVPEKVKVRYVSYAITNFLSRATVADADVLDYYDSHMDDYSQADTNGNVLPVPLEDIREEIVAALLQQQAASLARDAATEFAVALTPDRYGRAPTFDEAAAAAGLQIATSDFFSAYGQVPGLDTDTDFNRAAFQLDKADPEAYFSDALVGTATVYVLAADQRMESRSPDFEDVRDQVIAEARRQAEEQAAETHTQEIRETTARALAEGKSFALAMSAWNLNVTTTEAFTVYSGSSETFTNSEAIMPAVMTLRKGELTKPLDVMGGSLLAYVADRRPGEPGEADLLRPQLVATLDRYRARLLFEDWKEDILLQAGVEDTYAKTVADDADEQSLDEEADGPATDAPDPLSF